MLYSKKSLLICTIFILLNFLQLGRFAAGDVREVGGLVGFFTEIINPLFSLLGFTTFVTTFPLMFILAPLNNLVQTTIVFSMAYMAIGMGIIYLKEYFWPVDDDERSYHMLLAYLISYFVFQFIFDYNWKVHDTLVYVGITSNMDNFDPMSMMMDYSCSMLVALAIGFIYARYGRNYKAKATLRKSK